MTSNDTNRIKFNVQVTNLEYTVTGNNFNMIVQQLLNMRHPLILHKPQYD